MTSQNRARTSGLVSALILAMALVATACGGGDTPSSPEASAATAAAEANSELLGGGTNALDYEVLDVHDGSITTVEDVVDGNRSVLLWFFSPH